MDSSNEVGTFAAGADIFMCSAVVLNLLVLMVNKFSLCVVPLC